MNYKIQLIFIFLLFYLTGHAQNNFFFKAISYSPTNSASFSDSYSAIVSGQVDETNWRYRHNIYERAGANFPDKQFAKGLRNTTKGTSYSDFWIEFETDADSIEIYLKQNGSAFHLICNDSIFTVDISNTNGGLKYCKIPLPYSGTGIRTCALFGTSNFFFGGLVLPSGKQIIKPSYTIDEEVVIIGDSFAEGTSGYKLFGHIAFLRLKNPNYNIYNNSAGGTGYVNNGPLNRLCYRDRIIDDLNRHPQVTRALLTGGINDSGNSFRADVRQSAEDLIDSLQQINIDVYMLTPFWVSSSPTPEILEVKDSLNLAAANKGVPILADVTTLGQATSSDGTHPNSTGYLEIANFISFIFENNLLPVELDYFIADLVEDEVDMSWATLSEENNDYFEIERKYEFGEFESVGKIDGEGFSLEKVVYNYTNQLTKKGRYYYRLKQVDFDGTYTYSDTRVIDYKSSLATQITLFPNPTIDYLFLEGTEGFKNISFYNVSGQLQKSVNLSDNELTKKVVMTDLPKGNYFVIISTITGKVFTKKIVKL